MHPIRAVVHAGPLALIPVSGLSLLSRTVLTLIKAGIPVVTVVCGANEPGAFEGPRREIARAAPKAVVAWTRSGERDPHLKAGARVVVVGTDGVFRGSLIARLLARGRLGNVLMSFSGVESKLAMLGADEYIRFAAGAEILYEELQARADDYYPVQSAADVEPAERAIFSWCGKATDGIVSRLFNRPLSTWISRRLSHYDIAPRELTLVTALLALATFACLLAGTPAGLIVGCVLYQATSVVDGLDGEIARAKFMTSDAGAALDTAVDMASNLLFMIGISIGDARVFGPQYLWMGAFIAATAAAAIAIMTMTLRFGPGGGSFDVLQMTIQRRLAGRPRLHDGFLYINAMFKRDLFAFVFAGLGLLRLPQSIPWLLAFGTVTWLLCILLNVPTMLRADRDDILPPHLRVPAPAAAE